MNFFIACARTRISYAALIGASMDDVNGEYLEACKMRTLWQSLEADARGLRASMLQQQSPEEPSPGRTQEANPEDDGIEITSKSSELMITGNE